VNLIGHLIVNGVRIEINLLVCRSPIIREPRWQYTLCIQELWRPKWATIWIRQFLVSLIHLQLSTFIPISGNGSSDYRLLRHGRVPGRWLCAKKT